MHQVPQTTRLRAGQRGDGECPRGDVILHHASGPTLGGLHGQGGHQQEHDDPGAQHRHQAGGPRRHALVLRGLSDRGPSAGARGRSELVPLLLVPRRGLHHQAGHDLHEEQQRGQRHAQESLHGPEGRDRSAGRDLPEQGTKPVPHAADPEDTADPPPEEQEGAVQEQRQLLQLQQRSAERPLGGEHANPRQGEEAAIPEEDRDIEDRGQAVPGEDRAEDNGQALPGEDRTQQGGGEAIPG